METDTRNPTNRIIWIMIIIVVIIFASKYYNQVSEDPINLQKSESNKTFSKSIQVHNSEKNKDETAEPINQESEDIRTDTHITDDKTITNACGYINFGPANYEGTNKEGKTCADTVEPLRDNECVANPPKNYDGEIMIGESEDTLTCCDKDGTCQWGRSIYETG